MPEISIASVNGEWMNNWFTADAEDPAFTPVFHEDGHAPGNTDEAATRLAGLITALDADVVALMEAPSREAELRLFIDRYLTDNGTGRYECVIGDSGGAQKLALLYKPDVALFALAPAVEIGEVVDPWLADVDGDAVLDEYRFTRTPLITRATIGGTVLEVIVTHLKSNFINQGKKLWQDPATRTDFVRAALKNRRRIATEAMRLRSYLNRRLTADPSAAIVVLGDLNDGPGQDYFEQLYLAHNVTDILLGSPYQPELLFHHAPGDMPAEQRYSAVFDDYVTNEPNKQLLLDHILLAPAFTTPDAPLRKAPGSGTIAHEEWAAQVEGDGTPRDKRPTDHRPATVRISTPSQ
jgi:predicted extracellular nuclease